MVVGGCARLATRKPSFRLRVLDLGNQYDRSTRPLCFDHIASSVLCRDGFRFEVQRRVQIAVAKLPKRDLLAATFDLFEIAAQIAQATACQGEIGSPQAFRDILAIHYKSGMLLPIRVAE